MRKRKLILGMVLLLGGLGLTCGKKDAVSKDSAAQLEAELAKRPFNADMILPGKSTEKGIYATGTVTKVRREQAGDSLGSSAEAYLNSLLIGLVHTGYKVGSYTLDVEIAQFASPDDAYGFYSRMRPQGVQVEGIGTEAFVQNDRLVFTKGTYCIVLSTKSTEGNSEDALRILAAQIESAIDAPARRPQFFILFPFRGQVVPSQEYHSRSFLGIKGLDSVYTIDYTAGDDTLTLFLCMDTAGDKFVQVKDWAKSLGEIKKAPREFDYPSDRSLSFVHPEHGQIVVGLVRKKLAGFVGYDRGNSLELCTRWVKGLQ